MEIIHLGGETCVTGSCHLVRVNGLNIMVDCGMAQGNDLATPLNGWPVPPEELDYLFLTHAHLDHIGRIPELVANGFSGEILCTEPTKRMLIPMMSDALMFTDMDREMRKLMVKTLDELSWGFEFRTTFDLKKGVTFRFGRAGHILGSCFLRIETKLMSVVFSGDLGPGNRPILVNPDRPDPCDLLVLESTYGDKYHEGREERIERLGRILTKALADGGKVYIPAFSLGRTQELIYEMDRLFSDEDLKKQFPELNTAKKIPVFLDSPLGLEITEIYSDLSEYWNTEARHLLDMGDHPIDFDHLYTVKDHTEHLYLIDMPGPAIIVAGSGMCVGGRIVNHLKSGLGDSKNDVLFVGYQARGTLGRDILRFGKRRGGTVDIDGEAILVNARVYNLPGYSAHADQVGLVEWVESMPEKPREIKLVHGEKSARQGVSSVLERKGHSVTA